jgi:DNA-directed RNA polymerase specialized sigma subunit
MNNFTNFTNFAAINEAVKRISNEILSVNDINSYLQAVKKLIPGQVADTIYLTAKYNMVSQKDVDDVRNANKGQLEKLASKYKLSITEITDLWENLKSIKSNLRLLPQYQTASERNAFMNGKLLMSDITIDLETSAGRNACANQYMGMVRKIVNDYVGQSRLSKPELMSAALQGFTDAMNDWRKNGDESAVPFKTYAAYRVKQQILNDINEYSYSFKTNWYGVKKMGSTMLSALSLDSAPRDEEGEFKQDRLKSLGVNDPNYNLTKTEEDNWAELYKIIENTFKQRDINIFYRYFGLKGHPKEKGKDIAKSLGISPSLIKGVVQDIVLKKLQKNPKAMEILMDLQASYNESLMLDIMNLDKKMMVETILEDDMFILLEELTRWSNKNTFINTINNVFDIMESHDLSIIKDLLSNDFDNLDKLFKSNKKLIVKFLGFVYKTESFSRKSDVALLEYMVELGDLYKKYFV